MFPRHGSTFGNLAQEHGLLNPNGHLGFASSSHLVECSQVLWDLDAKQVSLFQARIDLSRFETIAGCPEIAT